MTVPRASGYDPADIGRVQSLALTLATVLGDLCEEELVIVGGFVPPLLIDQASLPPGAAAHIGTRDLDVALSVTVLSNERYEAIADRLLSAGFTRDVNTKGNLTVQRWRSPWSGELLIDFLIPVSGPGIEPGDIQHLTKELGAIATDGLELVWIDRKRVTLTGTTLDGATASRDVWVCGPGAFVVLKAIAFRVRGFPKDAYDLFYVLRNYGTGVSQIVAGVIAQVGDPAVQRALQILDEDFDGPSKLGPVRIASFEARELDHTLKADVVAYCREFTHSMRASPS